jgi:hypothetical protein
MTQWVVGTSRPPRRTGPSRSASRMSEWCTQPALGPALPPLVARLHGMKGSDIEEVASFSCGTCRRQHRTIGHQLL